MRSSRIVRPIVRLLGGAAVSALIIGGLAATPANAGAHGVKTAPAVSTKAHGV